MKGWSFVWTTCAQTIYKFGASNIALTMSTNLQGPPSHVVKGPNNTVPQSVNIPWQNVCRWAKQPCSCNLLARSSCFTQGTRKVSHCILADRHDMSRNYLQHQNRHVASGRIPTITCWPALKHKPTCRFINCSPMPILFISKCFSINTNILHITFNAPKILQLTMSKTVSRIPFVIIPILSAKSVPPQLLGKETNQIKHPQNQWFAGSMVSGIQNLQIPKPLVGSQCCNKTSDWELISTQQLGKNLAAAGKECSSLFLHWFGTISTDNSHKSLFFCQRSGIYVRVACEPGKDSLCTLQACGSKQSATCFCSKTFGSHKLQWRHPYIARFAMVSTDVRNRCSILQS